MLAQDVDLVARAIAKTYRNVKIDENYGWKTPALNTLDCVLSLNRRYNAVVKPRIIKFKRDCPHIKSLEDLKALMEESESPHKFVVEHLDYNHADRARMLREVIDYLLYEQSEYPGKSQGQRLKKWALSVRPGDAYFTGIKGFGLSGFQYLRMLFGAQTAKPDVHIKNYVSSILGRKVDDATSLVILERAASRENLPLREIDGAIWAERAR